MLVDNAAVKLTIGLIFVAVGAESLAAFNACVADPARLPDASALNVGAFFATVAAGIVLAVARAWVLAGERRVRHAASP